MVYRPLLVEREFMSEKNSKRILIGELIVIVLPSFLILLSFTISEISIAISPFPWSLWDWYGFGSIMIYLFACAAIISGLFISSIFIKKGSSGLHNINSSPWLISLIGLLLVTAGWVSKFSPPAQEYSAEELFRDKIEIFIFATPILIPLLHLILERFLHKEKAAL